MNASQPCLHSPKLYHGCCDSGPCLMDLFRNIAPFLPAYRRYMMLECSQSLFPMISLKLFQKKDFFLGFFQDDLLLFPYVFSPGSIASQGKDLVSAGISPRFFRLLPH